MEIATYIIWALRVVLPIILFIIYFRLQAPKDESYPGPNTHVHARTTLLNVRKTIPHDCALPTSLSNLKMVDSSQAPTLFISGGREARGGRPERRSRAGRDPDDKDKRERREKRSESRPEEPREAPEEPTATAAVVEEAAPEVPEVPSESQEKMHLESLLNYVAFNRKEQPRTFCIDEDTAPPPPPPKPKPKDSKPGDAPNESEGPAASSNEVAAKPMATVEKANAEAQMVLSGAIKFRRSDVAKNLYDQLVTQEVEVSDKTYTLMIDACVLAEDLKGASDLLMKMEASGHCPDTDLLDRVMDLYSKQKTQREKDKKAAKETERPEEDSALSKRLDELLASMPRAKLSKEADLFVPMLAGAVGVGRPPPPPPRPTASPESGVVDAVQAAPGATTEAAEQRTALKSTAKPFQPTGMGGGYDHDQYGWGMDSAEHEDWGWDAKADSWQGGWKKSWDDEGQWQDTERGEGSKGYGKQGNKWPKAVQDRAPDKGTEKYQPKKDEEGARKSGGKKGPTAVRWKAKEPAPTTEAA